VRVSLSLGGRGRRGCKRFTGAEIEQTFIGALHLAFVGDGAEPGGLTVGITLTKIVPLHPLMSEKLKSSATGPRTGADTPPIQTALRMAGGSSMCESRQFPPPGGSWREGLGFS
jgi:hypothetical protein